MRPILRESSTRTSPPRPLPHPSPSPGACRHLQYSPTEGDPRLQEALAARLTRRGLTTRPGELLVTTGSQQALALVANALLDPGAGPTLLYLVPTFANPTGRTLSAQRRSAVADLAAAHGLWVVEDDPYGELRYRGEHLAPLAADPPLADRALYLGSFSEIGAPGLRLGWLRAPAGVLGALTVARQAAAALYLATADLDAHVATLRREYSRRRDAMVDALAGVLPAGATVSDPDGGMFTWVRLPGGPDTGPDTAELLPHALAHDVAFVPGAPFYPEAPDRATLRLSFTTLTPDRIQEGVARLGHALAAWTS